MLRRPGPEKSLQIPLLGKRLGQPMLFALATGRRGPSCRMHRNRSRWHCRQPNKAAGKTVTIWKRPAQPGLFLQCLVVTPVSLCEIAGVSASNSYHAAFFAPTPGLFIFLSGRKRFSLEARGRLRPGIKKAERPRPGKGQMLDLAIVGGGPGGLMTAWYLRKKLGPLCKVTIFEATERVGGKIVSKKFDSAPAMYEAGVAEIYDYSMTGPGSVARPGAASRPADHSDRRRAGAARRRTAGRRARHAPQIRRRDRRRHRGVPQALRAR